MAAAFVANQQAIQASAQVAEIRQQLAVLHVEMLSVGVSDRGVLNQPVNLNCVPLIPDGDAKRHKVYTGFGNWRPTSSLRDRSCIPCTEVLVV